MQIGKRRVKILQKDNKEVSSPLGGGIGWGDIFQTCNNLSPHPGLPPEGEGTPLLSFRKLELLALNLEFKIRITVRQRCQML